MCIVMVRCPQTGKPIRTALEVDWVAFNRLPNISTRLHCPHCRYWHVFDKQEAWLARKSDLLIFYAVEVQRI